MNSYWTKAAVFTCLLATPLLAQHPDSPDGPPQHMGRGMPPMGPPGRWWTDPTTVQKLGLTADQQKKMDGIVEQSRLKLIDLSAALQKQEVIMQPLIEAEQPDEPKILSQIDKIAQARAELEKANARMLLQVRSVLTQDQWKKLQADAPRPGHFMGGPGGRGRPDFNRQEPNDRR
jgi:periplasmic protein CpxP/Spy